MKKLICIALALVLCLSFMAGCTQTNEDKEREYHMVIADLIARAATDYELPLGVITGFCGAPIFAFILIKKSKGNEAL